MQPGIDPRHVLTYGVSRGSEVALLLGVHYPELVNGVIALVPKRRRSLLAPWLPRSGLDAGGPAAALHETVQQSVPDR